MLKMVWRCVQFGQKNENAIMLHERSHRDNINRTINLHSTNVSTSC